MEQSFRVIRSKISYCHAFRLLPNLLTSRGKVMLKFLESKNCIGLEYFLPVLNNKKTTEGHMIRDFSKSLDLVLIYFYLYLISLRQTRQKYYLAFFHEPSSQRGLLNPSQVVLFAFSLELTGAPCSALPLRDAQAPSHPELAFRDPVIALLPGHFTPSPASLAWSLLAHAHSHAHPHSLGLLASWTHGPWLMLWRLTPSAGTQPPVHMRDHWLDRPSPRRELKEFNKKIVQTMLIRCMAWPDKQSTEPQPFTRLVLFISLPLNFLWLVPPQIT